MLKSLEYSTPSNDEQATSSPATLCRSRKRPAGAQPNTVPKLPDSEGPHTPLVVSKALTGSKPIRKESPRILRCHPNSESALRRLILTNGLLNPAHQDLNHQAMGTKTPQSRQNHCHQFKQHLFNSATPQKARLTRLNLPMTLSNLAHPYQTAWLHGQLHNSILLQVWRAPMTYMVPLRTLL
jgi:hypothetical protein